MIHKANLQPTFTAGSEHFIHICRPSVHTFQNKASLHYRQDCGLAEWIIEAFISLDLPIVFLKINFFIIASSITYLYTRYLFNWTEQEYTIYMTISSVFTSISSVLLLPLLSYKFKIHDALIGCFGAISGLAACIVLASIDKSWMMYLSKY